MLRVLSWDEGVERAFFAGKGRELPRPEYRVPANIDDSVVRFRELKATVSGNNAIEAFLRDTCDAFATAARMLAAVGTRDFYHHAVELYGRPASLTVDRKTTNLDLAEQMWQARTARCADQSPTPSEQRLALVLTRTAQWNRPAAPSS